MPYTLAHPAAVLPFFGFRRLSRMGLIIGALSPDLEHTLRFQAVSHFSHTLAGLFYFCLPLGIVLTYAARRYWWSPLRKIFPEIPAVPPRESVIWLALSVLIGATSHILWDSFTHSGRWGVENFSLLSQNFFQINGQSFPLWNVLQHLSTLGGAVIIAIFTKWKAKPLLKTSCWATAASIVMTLFVLRMNLPMNFSVKLWLVTFACNLILGFAIVLSFMNARQRSKARTK
jgi:hypothetical protein